MRARFAGVLGAALLLAGCGGAAREGDPAARPSPAATARADAPTEAMRAYAQAAERMHAGMAAPDRDPDIAFARGMIPHHQGAVEMAKVELRYGRDPEMRKLAEAVIAAQASEIALMERWLARQGRRPASDPRHGH